MKNQSSILKTFRFWFSFFAVIYFISTIFIIPFIVKNQTIAFLNDNLKHKTTLEKVSFNPFGFEIQFYNFKIYDTDDDILIDFETIRVDFDLLTTIFTQVVHFDSFSLYKPTINIKLLKDGKLNLMSLVPPKTNEKEKPLNKEAKNNKLFPINFNEIKLEKAEIFFTDYTVLEPFKVTLFPLNYNFVNLSTQVKEQGTYNFDITVNKHTKLQGNGKVSLNPIIVNGNLSLSKLHIGDFWTRIEKEFKFYINDAIFDLNSNYNVSLINDNLKINLEKTNAKLSNFKLGSKKESKDLITLDTFKTSNVSLSWPSQDVTIQKIDFNSLFTDLVIHKNIRTNIAELFQKEIINDEVKNNEIKKQIEPIKEDIPWNVSISALNLRDSKVDITDLSKTNPFKAVLNKIDYEFKDLSTKDNGIKKQKLTVQINNHTNLDLNGKVEFEPLKLEGSLNIEDIQTNDFWSHVKDEVNFDIHDTRLDLSTKYLINIQKDLDVILNNANVNISNLNISSKQSKNSIISIKGINTKIKSFDLRQQDMKIDDLLLDKLYTNFELNKNKTNNIEPLFVQKQKDKALKQKKKKESKKTKEKEWNVSLNNVELKDSKVSFKDKTINKTFTTSLNKINLNVKNIDLKPKTIFTYKLKSKIDKKAKLTSSGKVSIKPLSVNSIYKLSNLHLNIFQPYLDETLNLDVKKANFNTQGKFKLEAKTNNISLYANTQIKNINIKHKDSRESLIKIKKVDINKLNFDQSKNSLKINSINLAKPYAKVHIDKNKVTNFSNISKKSIKIEEKKTSVKKKKEKEFLFDLGPIKINNGSMDFTDLSLPLPFQSFIEDLEGSISELSSHSSKPSDILINGVIDKYGLAKINGSLDYKNIEQNTQINMLFKNIATKNLTPYSSEFIGRKIDGGKLTLDLNYKIIESKLDATNKIVIHKIKLGKTIKSENSISVPIDLAIALLEDSNGVIDLSLPVTGDVNDPKFQIGSVVGQAFANLIIKMVTSPFTFLGKLLGISEDKIKFVDFEAGKFELLPPAKENLDVLVKALNTRPTLALELEKTYNKDVDTLAIKKSKFELELNSFINELKKGIVKKEKENKETNTVKIDTYLVSLESMYLKTSTKEQLEKLKKTFVKEIKDKKVFEKTKYLNHIKQLQIQNQKVTQQELELLATSRASEVSSYLVKTHKIDIKRLVTKDFKILNGEEKNKWIKSELGITVKK